MKILTLFIFTINSVTALLATEYFTSFSKQDLALQSVFTLVTCYDWVQTKEFRREGPGQKYEKNPILGKEPSQERVNTLIFGAIIGHALVTYALPKKYREYWQVSFISIEAVAVSANHRNGVRVIGNW